jgi:CheY-like chemotaxis protein
MILLLDDNTDAGTVLKKILSRCGYEAIAVTDVQAALALLHARKPALFVTDIDMPDMDGLSLLRLIRDQPQLHDVKVMVLSADFRHETAVEARRLNVVDFLVKGAVSIQDLVARISQHAGQPVPPPV